MENKEKLENTMHKWWIYPSEKVGENISGELKTQIE
jgi:hypothetical protein